MNHQEKAAPLQPGTKLRRPMNVHTLLKILVGVAALVYVVACFYNCFSQTFVDTFYMVASGNWMIEHKAIQTAGISSPIPMRFVSQNWLFCLLAAGCLRVSEAVGLNWYGMSLMTVAMFVCYATCSAFIARKVTGGSRIAMLLTLLVFVSPSSSFCDFRSHSIVFALTAYCLWANKNFSDTGDMRPLFVVPILAILHSNLQATTALTEPLICLGYAASSFILNRRQRRRALVTLLIGLLCVAAVFVNPYGIDAVSYVFTSTGVAGYKGYINEMVSLGDLGGDGHFLDYAFYLWNMAQPSAFLFLALRSQWYRQTYHPLEDLMALAGICSFVLAFRNLTYATLLTWWVVIVSWDEIRSCILHVATADSLADMLVLGGSRGKSIVTYLSYALVLVAIFGNLAPMLTSNPLPITEQQLHLGILTKECAPIESADLIAESSADARPHVLADLNLGSYLEYRGYIVNVTSRWETWEPAISGTEEHFYYDSADAFTIGDDESEAALERLLAVDDWDYALIEIRRDSTSGKQLIRRIERMGGFEEIFTESLTNELDAVLLQKSVS